MFSSLFSRMSGQKTDLREVIDQGAVLVDVRTPAEFALGSVPGAKNYPLDSLQGKIASLKKMKKPVIVFCASGMRSASAKAVLQRGGLEEVHNGGSVQKVQRYF